MADTIPMNNIRPGNAGAGWLFFNNNLNDWDYYLWFVIHGGR
jgi:hypothetical protein